MKYLSFLLLFSTAVAAQDVKVLILEDGTELEVPEDKKVVYVRKDSPPVCFEVDFLELVMPTSDCSGLTVSPGCDSQR
jgi:hypothetical protein